MKTLYKILLACIMILIISGSCKKVENDFNFTTLEQTYPLQSQWVLPVGNASFDLDTTKLSHLAAIPVIHFSDTIHFDFSRFSQIVKNIGSLLFRINSFNQYPSIAITQVYFGNANPDSSFKMVVDSIFNPSNQQVVDAATISTVNGTVIKEG